MNTETDLISRKVSAIGENAAVGEARDILKRVETKTVLGASMLSADDIAEAIYAVRVLKYVAGITDVEMFQSYGKLNAAIKSELEVPKS